VDGGSTIDSLKEMCRNKDKIISSNLQYICILKATIEKAKKDMSKFSEEKMESFEYAYKSLKYFLF
jgi:hypothetical protein